MLSLVVPVYRNEGSIGELVDTLAGIDRALDHEFEAVLVVDGSPDRSLDLLAEALPAAPFRSRLLALSRNFGSFPAILAGLDAASGERFAVMAADLQEPPELVARFDDLLRAGAHDVVVGVRGRRADPLSSRLASALFWRAYRVLVNREIPARGVDVFGCNRAVRDQLVALRESHTSLVGLLYWLGFRRAEVTYDRRERRHGRSAWSFGRRLRYLLDSTFSFTDLPVRLLSFAGLSGMALAAVLAAAILFAKWREEIPVPGYAATALLVIFFGSLNAFGLGIVGEYVWRTYENGKARPPFVVASRRDFAARRPLDGPGKETTLEP
jgi:glycosyltransferase involved in cell wall biosynthesis